MKKIILLISLCLAFTYGFSQSMTYYYVSGPFTTAGNWNTVPGGGGTPASAFTFTTDTWIVNTALTINTAWTIAGTLQIGDGSSANTVSISTSPSIGGCNVMPNATLTLSANPTFTAGNIFVNNGGTLNVNVASTATSPALASTQGAVSQITYGTGASHVLPIVTFGNLTLNDAIAFTMGGNVTVAGTMTFTSGTLTIGANTLTLNQTVSGMSAANFITGSASSNLTIGSTVSLGTLFFSQATPGTTNKIATLTLNGSGGTTTLGNAMAVGTSLSVSSGATLNMGGNVLTLTGATISNSGTVQTAATAGAFVGAANWGSSGTVTYNAGAAQSIIAATYNNLTTGNGSFNYTGSGAITVNGALTVNTNSTYTAGGTTTLGSSATLTVNSGSTLAMSTFQLAGTPATVSNSGTITTACLTGTSATPLPSGYTWGGTVNYNSGAATAQTIVTGTYNNLSLSSHTTGAVTLASGTINVGGNFVVTAGSTSFTTTGNTFIYTSLTGGQTIGGITYKNLTFNNTSGVNTAGAAVTTTGTFTTTAGGTLNMAGLVLTLTGATIANNGTVETTLAAGAFAGATNWGSAGTVIYNDGAAQSVIAGIYNNLTVGNGAFTYTASGNITINGTLTVNTGSTLAMSTFVMNGTPTIANSGTVSTACPTGTSPTPLPAGLTWNGLVSYTGANTVAQTLVTGTFTNLTVSVAHTTGALTLASGLIKVSGNFTASSATTVTNTGNTFEFTSLTGGQTVGSMKYNNLTLDNTSLVNTASGAITVAGTLTTAAGGTFNMAANVLTLTGATIANNGTVETTAAAGAFSNAANWGSAGTVLYNLAGNQSIITGTYYNLTIGNGVHTYTGSGAITANGTLTLNTGLTFTAGGTVNLGSAAALIVSTGCTMTMGTYQLAGTPASVSNSGTITTACLTGTSAAPLPAGYTWGGTVSYISGAATAQTIVTGTYTTLTLSSHTTGAVTLASGSIKVSGNFTVTAGSTSFITTGNTFEYTAAAGAQTIGGITYNNLTLDNTSGIDAAGAAITVAGTLTTTAGGIFNMAANILTLTGATIANNGTVETTAAAGAFTGASNWGSAGTVIYNAAANQAVIAGTYNNLTVGNGVHTYTGSGAITVNNTFTINTTITFTAGGTITLGSSSSLIVNTGSTFGMSTFQLAGTPASVSNNGTITTACLTGTSALPIPAGYTWGGTVSYLSGAATAQTIVTGTYNNLSLSSHTTGAVTLASGTIKVGGNFTVTAGSTSFTTTGNTFEYTALAGGQTIGGITYRNLQLDNTSGIDAAGAAITVAGTLTTTTGGILNMAANVLTLTGATITNNGTVETTAAAGAFVGATNWGTAGTVIYNDGAAQAVITGIYNNLTIGNGVFTYIASNNISVNGVLTVNTGSTFAMSTFILGGTPASISNSGTITTACLTGTSAVPLPAGSIWGGTVSYVSGAATAQTIVTGTYNILTLSSHTTGAVTLASGTIKVGGNFVVTAGSTSFTTAGNTFEYTATGGGQTIGGITYNNLTLDNTSGTNTAGAAVTVGGILTTSGGTLNMNALALSGALTTSGTGLIQTTNTTAAPVTSGRTWSQTILYNNATGTQTIVAGTYNGGLTNSNTSGTNTLAAAITVGGDLTLSPLSTLADGGFTLTLAGNLAGSGTHTGSGKISMNGTGKTISSVIVNNLTLSNGANFSLVGNPQINGIFALTTGTFNIGNYTLTFGTSGSFAGTPSATNMIYSSGTGSLNKLFNANASFTFPIGDNTGVYSPLALNFTASAYAAGAYVGVVVYNVKESHNPSATNYLNRYWAVSTSGITSPSYTVTGATYAASDVTGTENLMSTAAYNGSAISVIAGSAVNTGTHTLSATGPLTGNYEEITGAYGLVASVIITSSSPSSICIGGNEVLNADAIGIPAISYTWSPSTGLSATTGMSVTATPTVTTVYTVNITDALTHTATNTYTLNVTPAVTAAPSNNSPFCSGGTVNLNANPGGGASAYSWSGPGLSSSVIAAPTATPTASVTYSVTVSNGTSNPGCVLNLTTAVSVNPAPSAAPSNSGPVCQGDIVSLSSDPTGGVTTYSWSGPFLSSATDANPTAVPTITSTYSLTVSSGSASGCSPVTVYTTSVVVNSLPAITAISNSGPVCANNLLSFSCTVSGGTGPGTYNYSWSGPSSFSSALQNPFISTPTSAASGTYTLTVTDGNICGGTGTNTTTATVYDLPVISSIGNNSPLCDGTATLNITSAASGGAGSYTYLWAGPSSFTSSLQNPSIPAATTAAGGVYTLTVTDANSCNATGTNTTTVSVNPFPAVSPITGPSGVCNGSTVTLNDATGGGVWTSGSSVATIGSSSGMVTGAALGIVNITYTVTTASCSTSVSYPFTVEDVPLFFYTCAGTGVGAYSGDGGLASLATLRSPRALASDTAGNIYISDLNAYNVRKISVNGYISTVAGNGSAGNSGDGGQATAASLNMTGGGGLWVDQAGNILISNTAGQTIRMVNASTGIITTIAGTAGTAGFSGDGGPAAAALLFNPIGICEDTSGNIYFADASTYHIRRIDAATGYISTIIGTGSNAYSGDGGLGINARVSIPRDVAADYYGNLYIADYGNNVIRKYVIATGIITTFAGTGAVGSSGDGGPATAALFNGPARVTFDGGNNLYIVDQGNNKIRQIDLTTGLISTAIATGTAGFSGDGGPATSAKISFPGGIAVNKYGYLYVSDANNHRVRVSPFNGTIMITTDTTSIPAGTSATFTANTSLVNNLTYQWQINGSPVSGATNNTYTDYSVVSGNIYTCVLTVTPDCSTGYSATSNSITITTFGPPAFPTEVTPSAIANGLRYYPNPVHNSLTITGEGFADGPATISVFDQLSRVVFSRSAMLSDGIINEQIDMQSLPAGLYIIYVTDAASKTGIIKCVKN